MLYKNCCGKNAERSFFLIIDMACDPTQHADLAAVIMQEGLAHLCLITPNMTLLRAKIETTIPRKRKGMCAQHDKVK
jgi:protein pelota